MPIVDPGSFLLIASRQQRSPMSLGMSPEQPPTSCRSATRTTSCPGYLADDRQHGLATGCFSITTRTRTLTPGRFAIACVSHWRLSRSSATRSALLPTRPSGLVQTKSSYDEYNSFANSDVFRLKFATSRRPKLVIVRPIPQVPMIANLL